MLENLANQLSVLAQEQNLTDKAISCCRVALKNCADEEAELFPEANAGPDILCGYKLSDIAIEFRSVSLIFNHQYRSYIYFNTQLLLSAPDPEWKGHEIPLGSYNLYTTEAGEIIDDDLIIDVPLIDPTDQS